MFNRTKSPAPPPRPETGAPLAPVADASSAAPGAAPSAGARPAAPPVAQRGLSTLSSDLQYEGTISGAGDLQIEGAVKGDVRVGRLIVGETGGIEGNVSADYVEVRGRIIGNVSGKQVKLIATAYVDGDITAEQLSIDIGAYFQGRVLQGRREAPPAGAPRPSTAAASAAPPHGDDRPRVVDTRPVA